MSTSVDPLELASALQVEGQLDRAEPLYRDVLRGAPEHRVARNNLIALLRAQARWAEAETLLREAISLFPGDAELKLRLATWLLADDRFEEGWTLFEARRAAAKGVAPPALSIPEWTGGPVESLLVWPEPGVGDMILFGRFLPELARRGIRAALLCPPPLASLFADAGLTTVAASGAVSLPPHAAWSMIGSLPLRLGVTPETVPPPLTLNLRPSQGGGVGVIVRDLPAELTADLLARPGAVPLEPIGSGVGDLRSTAEVVAGLDHVVTTDNDIAHLAAALGKPTSILLSRTNANWRFPRDRSESPWVPGARLYRETAANGWRAVVDEVRRDLDPLLARPALRSPRQPSAARAETDRRKAAVAAGATDRERWADPGQLDRGWDQRARLAAAYAPRGARVLDLGCGAMALEAVLPDGCAYIPCDLVARDSRTIVCDFNAGEFPADAACDLVTVLGVLEYLYDPQPFLAKLQAVGRPVVLSYNLAGAGGPADRRALGWANDFTQEELLNRLAAAGFNHIVGGEVSPGQVLLRLSATQPAAPERSVWVLSYASVANFGDRLGVQVLSSILPPNARVRRLYHQPWEVPPEGRPDLLIVGAGNSMFDRVLTPELLELAGRAERAIGIFGTQHRQDIDPVLMSGLLDRLDTWWARTEEDAYLYGAGRDNVRHLGDLLIEAFPMAQWSLDQALAIAAEIDADDVPLDRLIERIQAYRTVKSARLHPLLCALTSAERVAYEEQRRPNGQATGKFRSLLMDIFGVEKPEQQLWTVDRAAVRAYKAKVRAGVDALRQDLSRTLG